MTVTPQPRRVALGNEVMTVNPQEKDQQIARLLAAVGDEAAALDALEGCVTRLHDSRDAKVALAQLTSADLRAALSMRRQALGEERL
ncbi:MAG TPA: hypothetical protein VF391_05660 [Dermatophilaceae bacterium]|jgi:hypothetical protein